MSFNSLNNNLLIPYIICMKKKIFRRTDINITEEEYELLQKEIDEKGLSMSDIIRRAIDKYFEDKN